MKNRTRENCTSGSVRDEDGNILIYSANDRGDRGNVGIMRSPVRASILPNRGAGNRLRRPGGCGNGAMVEPVRHRRTKGAATDMLKPKATASHLDSTILD
jgi:hypothetical protein